MDEIWKPIEGWEEKYTVSNLGRVQDLRTGRIIKASAAGHGSRLQVKLRDSAKICYTSRMVSHLVYSAFISPVPGGWHIEYRDRNPLNVAATNLYLKRRDTFPTKQAPPYGNNGGGARNGALTCNRSVAAVAMDTLKTVAPHIIALLAMDAGQRDRRIVPPQRSA